jgi:hypothetical protein
LFADDKGWVAGSGWLVLAAGWVLATERSRVAKNPPAARKSPRSPLTETRRTSQECQQNADLRPGIALALTPDGSRCPVT